MLHIVNKSPFEKNSLESSISVAADGSAVLMIEDGVYGVLKGSRVEEMVKGAMGSLKIYALGPDVEARGIADKVMDGITLVDYNGFVALTTEHDKVQSWL